MKLVQDYSGTSPYMVDIFGTTQIVLIKGVSSLQELFCMQLYIYQGPRSVSILKRCPLSLTVVCETYGEAKLHYVVLVKIDLLYFIL